MPQAYEGPREELARRLYRTVVAEWVSDSLVKTIRSHLPDHVQAAFADQYLLYTEANVLRVLITQQEQGRNLLHAFERVLFGADQSKVPMDKISAIRLAMVDLDKLFFSEENKKLSW